MKKILVSALALAAAAGAARAQTPSIQFEILERQAQIAWDGHSAVAPLNDNVLNFTVLAKVVGGAPGQAIGNFSFDVVSNDATGNGTLFKANISNPDGTTVDHNVAPFTSSNPNPYGNNATIGHGGLSAIYSYLAGINPNFNGLINTSGGTFTENPAINDIGLVTGSPTGGALLLLADTMGTGNPDTYSGSGTTAPLDPTLADTYLGADGHFSALYNFNYTISSNASRVITFSLANITAQTFTSLALASGVWGPDGVANATTSSTGAQVTVTPAPSAMALLGLGGLVAARRRRA